VTAWENDILKFEQLDKDESYPEESVLFAGSSSIRLWSTLKDDLAPYTVIQRGYGGAKLSDFAVYADRLLNPHKCRAIVIFIANDISGSEQDKSPEEVLSLYKYVVKTIRNKQHDTPVFWIAITPTSSRWQVWPEIQKANNLIKEYCDSNKGLYFIKTDFAFLGKDGKPINEFFRDDLLHLNADGYAVWRKIIKDELDRVLLK
jgi:lysophospholipase L1-like esterase